MLDTEYRLTTKPHTKDNVGEPNGNTASSVSGNKAGAVCVCVCTRMYVMQNEDLRLMHTNKVGTSGKVGTWTLVPILFSLQTMFKIASRTSLSDFSKSPFCHHTQFFAQIFYTQFVILRTGHLLLAPPCEQFSACPYFPPGPRFVGVHQVQAPIFQIVYVSTSAEVKISFVYTP